MSRATRHNISLVSVTVKVNTIVEISLQLYPNEHIQYVYILSAKNRHFMLSRSYMLSSFLNLHFYINMD